MRKIKEVWSKLDYNLQDTIAIVIIILTFTELTTKVVYPLVSKDIYSIWIIVMHPVCLAFYYSIFAYFIRKDK